MQRRRGWSILFRWKVYRISADNSIHASSQAYSDLHLWVPDCNVLSVKAPTVPYVVWCSVSNCKVDRTTKEEAVWFQHVQTCSNKFKHVQTCSNTLGRIWNLVTVVADMHWISFSWLFPGFHRALAKYVIPSWHCAPGSKPEAQDSSGHPPRASPVLRGRSGSHPFLDHPLDQLRTSRWDCLAETRIHRLSWPEIPPEWCFLFNWMIKFGNEPLLCLRVPAAKRSVTANDAASSGLPIKNIGSFDGAQPWLFVLRSFCQCPNHDMQGSRSALQWMHGSGIYKSNIVYLYIYIYLLCSPKLSTQVKVLFSLTMDENSNRLRMLPRPPKLVLKDSQGPSSIIYFSPQWEVSINGGVPHLTSILDCDVPWNQTIQLLGYPQLCKAPCGSFLKCGNPKSSILIGLSLINQAFGGTAMLVAAAPPPAPCGGEKTTAEARGAPVQRKRCSSATARSSGKPIPTKPPASAMAGRVKLGQL